MKCDPTHGPAVATVQIMHPTLSVPEDEICAECLPYWEGFAAAYPKLHIRIERLDPEEDWGESFASALLLALALLPWMLVW